jgi:uncharacterized membrane protein YcjF (UPF0283 family)
MLTTLHHPLAMPHRLIDLPPVLMHTLEAVILGLALGWNGAAYLIALISESDWQRLTGPHGVAFIAVVAVVVLWLNKLSSDKARAKELATIEKKEDARRMAEEAARELRHAESLKASGEYAHSMKALAVESMKVSMRVDHTLGKLIQALSKRPCQGSLLKDLTDTPPETPPEQ